MWKSRSSATDAFAKRENREGQSVVDIGKTEKRVRQRFHNTWKWMWEWRPERQTKWSKMRVVLKNLPSPSRPVNSARLPCRGHRVCRLLRLFSTWFSSWAKFERKMKKLMSGKREECQFAEVNGWGTRRGPQMVAGTKKRMPKTDTSPEPGLNWLLANRCHSLAFSDVQMTNMRPRVWFNQRLGMLDVQTVLELQSEVAKIYILIDNPHILKHY